MRHFKKRSLSGNTDLLDKARLEKKVAALESERKSFYKDKSGSTWKKEDELKKLKSEVAVLERKIQLSLAPSRQTDSGDMEQTQDIKAVLPENGGKKPSTDDRIVIVRPKPLVPETSKGIKL